MLYVWFEKMKLCCYVLLHFFCLPSFFYLLYIPLLFCYNGFEFLLCYVVSACYCTYHHLTSTVSNLRKRILIFCFATLLTHAIVFLLQFLCLQLFSLYYVGFKKRESEFFFCFGALLTPTITPLLQFLCLPSFFYTYHHLACTMWGSTI